MKELFNVLSDEEKMKYIYFMDNLASHLAPALFTLYNENKMKVLFNTPYKSSFNIVELCFRY